MLRPEPILRSNGTSMIKGRAKTRFRVDTRDRKSSPGLNPDINLPEGWCRSVQVYIAKAPSTAASFDGSGTVWTKVYSSGLLDASTSKWATDVVRFFPCMCVPGPY